MEEKIERTSTIEKKSSIDELNNKRSIGKKFVWRQKFKDDEGKDTIVEHDMFHMDEKFLSNVSINLQKRIIEKTNNIEALYNLLEEIDIVANKKGFTLPDIKNLNLVRK